MNSLNEGRLARDAAEIDRRMPTDRPEAALLLDRALAWELLGELGPARADYTAAAGSGAAGAGRGAASFSAMSARTASSAPGGGTMSGC